MKLYTLQIPKDVAWDVMFDMGQAGHSQFIDLNKDEPVHTLPYHRQVKACEEAERKLAYIHDQCNKYFVTVTPPENTEGFMTQLKRITQSKKKATSLLLEEIQKEIERQEKFIQEQNIRVKESGEILRKSKDFAQVLKVAFKMIPQLNQQQKALSDVEKGTGINARLIEQKLYIDRIAGVANTEDVARLRKLVFRATKGKSFMYAEQYEDKDEPEERKSVYIISFYDGAHTVDKIQRICDSFTGQRFVLPEFNDFEKTFEQVKKTIVNQKSIFERTQSEIRKQLMDFDTIKGSSDGIERPSSTIYIYKMFLAQEKTLYQTLNMMKSQKDYLLGYYWSPAEYEFNIKTALQKQTATKITEVNNQYGIMPPTFNKITDFTNVFQMIVDTYGVPTYKEANPVPVSIVSFPFFFGVMFGDMGHGSILCAFGIYLTLMGHKLDKTALKPFVEMRYFLLLMGICSTYCGLLYNEFFAMPAQLFSSCYELGQREIWKNADGSESNTYYYMRKGENQNRLTCTYPMGMDTVWGLSKQRLNLANNIKMKLSVIFGVIHMSIGVVIKGTNLVRKCDIAGLLWEVIGGLIILLGLFGWMNLLIYGKWFFVDGLFTDRTPVTIDGKPKWKGDVLNQNAPSVVNILIVSVFSMGNSPNTNYAYLYANKHDPDTWLPLQDGQVAMYGMALILLKIVLVFVPMMLCAKPCLFKIKGGGHDHHEAHGEVELHGMQQVHEENFAINRSNSEALLANKHS